MDCWATGGLVVPWGSPSNMAQWGSDTVWGGDQRALDRKCLDQIFSSFMSYTNLTCKSSDVRILTFSSCFYINLFLYFFLEYLLFLLKQFYLSAKIFSLSILMYFLFFDNFYSMWLFHTFKIVFLVLFIVLSISSHNCLYILSEMTLISKCVSSVR